ncbi:MAG TPA: WG repeat-containing protein, partial [Chryseosolibacter sp.]
MRFVFLWLAVVFVPTQTSYSKDGSIDHAISSANFSRFEENGKVGLKDENGRILIPAIYEAIGWSNGNLLIIDKVVGYQSGGLWGLIHTSNKTITPAEFLDLKPGKASLLIAQKKSRLTQRPSFGIINTSGKTIIPFIYDGLELSDMRAVVMSRSGTKYQFGLIDLSHKILIPVEFQKIYSLGSLRYAVENFENKTAIYSDEGGQITGFTIDSISVFKKDFAVVYQNQKQGLIDRSGQMILNPIYGEVRLKENGGVEVRDTNEWFFLSGENQVISQHKADGLRPLSANHYVITSGGKLRLTSNDLKPLHGDFLLSIGDFNNGLALFRKASG